MHTQKGKVKAVKANIQKEKDSVKNKEVEKRIIEILTERKLSALKAMLEKDHAIDCLLMAILNKGQWKSAKEFARELKLTLPDGTYRARMMELELNGIVRHEKIDPKKKRWIATDFGRQMGDLLILFFLSLESGRRLT